MRLALAVLCVTCLFTAHNARGQAPEAPSLRIAAGTVVTFHVQSRLQTEANDPLAVIRQGTPLHVRLLDGIDSAQDRDGASFRGTLVSSIGSGKAAIRADARVHGILVLLRSRSHPNGFRYELMVTSITANGRSHPLSASMSPSLFETAVVSAFPASDPAPSPASLP